MGQLHPKSQQPGKTIEKQYLLFEKVLSDSIHEVISSSLLFYTNKLLSWFVLNPQLGMWLLCCGMWLLCCIVTFPRREFFGR